MKKWKYITATALLTLALAACGAEEESTTDTATEDTATEQSADTSATENSAFPMTVAPLTAESEDEESGTKTVFEDVTLEQQPERLVVLDYGFLDTLDALGVEGVVGVAQNGGKGFLPENLKEKYFTSDIADAGSLKELNLEAVAAAEPDVIFISGRQAGYYEELTEITPNVIYIASDNEDYVQGIYESVDLAAKIFGKEDKAEELKAAFQEKVDALKEKASGYENALVTMYNEKKLSGFDNGEKSRFAYVYNDFGFNPAVTGIETSSHGSDFSFESVLKVDPEVLLVVDRGANEEVAKADVENNIIKQTRAYKDGKIVYLDGTTWYFSSGGITTETSKIDEILNELK